MVIKRLALTSFSLALGGLVYSCGVPESGPRTGADPLLSVDIPEGFTFATSRPLTLRADLPPDVRGRTLAEVRLADGSLVYRGPLTSPTSVHVPVGTTHVDFTLKSLDGDRAVTVAVTGDEAVVPAE